MSFEPTSTTPHEHATVASGTTRPRGGADAASLGDCGEARDGDHGQPSAGEASMTLAHERTCVGCRGVAERDELVRFVRADVPAKLVPDLRRRLPGRGVSVHPRRGCIEAACTKGGFARSLRTTLRVSPQLLLDSLRIHYEARIDSLLLAARRRSLVIVGTDSVRQKLAAVVSANASEGDAGRAARLDSRAVLVVAHDAANRRDDLTEAARRAGRSCVVHGTKASLGRLLGRTEVGVVLVIEGGMAEAIASVARSLNDLMEEA